MTHEAHGVVRGFDGKPIAGAIVVARTASVAGVDALTDEAGRFRVACPAAIASMCVQLEGVRIDVPIAAGNTADLAVSFEHVEHSTLRGRVLQPDGAPATGVELLCRDSKRELAISLVTDAEGAFAVRFGQPVGDVLVDPLGWRHLVQAPAAGQELVVDMRSAARTWFAVTGMVRDERGEPVAAGIVQGLVGQAGAGSTRTRSDGSYTLWTNRAIDELLVHGTDPRIVRRGPWAKASTVDLDARTHGLVLRVGRCVGADGKGLTGTMIFAVDQAGPPKKGVPSLTATGSGGWFRVMLPRDTAFVFAWCEGGNLGGCAAVPADQRVIEVQLTASPDGHDHTHGKR